MSFNSTTKLRDTRVLILGGTSGIGFAVASLALEHGATVIVSSSKPSKVTQAIQRLKTAFPDPSVQARVEGHACDLGSDATLEQNLVTLLEKATRSAATGEKVLLDHIVFTAGDALSMPPLAEISVQFVHDAARVRLMGSLMLAKHAAAYIKRSPRSSITLTSGTNATKPAKGWSVIAAVAAGSEGLARGLAVDLAPVRVNCISPGTVRTELIEGMIPDPKVLEGVMESFRNDTLTNEVGLPQEVAEAYLYVMKDRFVNGVTLETSGGRLLK